MQNEILDQPHFSFKNNERSSSLVLAGVILSCFLIYFVYIEWYILAFFYSIFMLYMVIYAKREKSVTEILINGEKVVFHFTHKMKVMNLEHDLKDVKANLKRNPTFKFSEVHDLIINIKGDNYFVLKGQSEFSSDSIHDLNILLNSKNAD